MKNSLVKITLPRLLAVLLTLLPVLSHAQGTNSPIPTNAVAAARPLPFRGTVTAVDAAAQTITVGNRVFTVTPHTRIGKFNHAATLSDISVGDLIGGSYLKSAGGKLEAISLRVIPHPTQTPEKAATSAAPGIPAAPAVPATTH